MGKREEENQRTVAWYLRYSYLGFEFLLCIGVPLGLGIWLDKKLGTKVLFTLLGLGLGFTAGFYSIYGAIFGRRGQGPPRSGHGAGSGDPGETSR